MSSRTGHRISIFAAAIALAFVATGCDCFPRYDRLDRVASLNGLVYAYSTSVSNTDETKTYVALSKDGGKTWNDVVRAEMPREAIHDASLPRVVCNEQRPQLCYRISKPEQIEQSVDGGQTWQVAWSIPAGRREYMERIAQARNCGKGLDLGPYDLAFYDGSDGATLIVAMGLDAVMVRTPNGVWQPYAVLGYEPIYFSAQNLDQALAETGNENLIWLIGAFLSLFVGCFYCWRTILARPKAARANELSLRPILPFLIAIILILASCVTPFTITHPWELPPVIQMLVYLPLRDPRLFLLILLCGILLTWINVARRAWHPRLAWRAAGWCVLLTLGVFPLGWSPLVLWSFGVIPYYSIAIVCAMIATGVLVVWAGYQAHLASILAATAPAPGESNS